MRVGEIARLAVGSYPVKTKRNNSSADMASGIPCKCAWLKMERNIRI